MTLVLCRRCDMYTEPKQDPKNIGGSFRCEFCGWKIPGVRE